VLRRKAGLWDSARRGKFVENEKRARKKVFGNGRAAALMPRESRSLLSAYDFLLRVWRLARRGFRRWSEPARSA
jgi:hypothetical protein